MEAPGGGEVGFAVGSIELYISMWVGERTGE